MPKSISWILFAVVIVFGIALMGFAELMSMWGWPSWLVAFANNVSAFLIATLAIAIYWDRKGRESFFREVDDNIESRIEASEAGIENIYRKFSKDPKWDRFFEATDTVDIAIVRGNTWRNTNSGIISNFLKSEANSINLYVPNIENEHLMDIVSRRVNQTIEDERKYILRSLSEWMDCGLCYGNVRIFQIDFVPSYTLYLGKYDAIFTLYKNHPGRADNIPCFRVRSAGHLYEFFKEDMRQLKSHAKTVRLEKEGLSELCKKYGAFPQRE
ncbi:hypothetical protein [Rhodospirillum sp. A1_3_36]|uniref:hypothetical protein n=1 Tax=Rhodospirillum sp. A1_3_36 TaxID=3391666 RepID=UPI0039A6C9A9